MNEMARKLSEEELFQCLKSLNVPVRLSDIKTPTKDFIIKVVECFIKDLQIDVRTLSLRPLEALDHLENPEISEDARMLLLLMTCVNYFIAPDGIVLRLKDITEPKPKRTKKILNYLIVFWNFALTKYALFEGIADSYRDELEKIDDLIRENENLSEKYTDCINELENLQSEKDELIQYHALVSAKYEEVSKERDTSADEYQDLKNKEQDLRNQIVATNVNIVSVKEAIIELDQCILTSPERFTVDINKLKDHIKQEEQKIKDKETNLREIVKNRDALEALHKDCMKAEEVVQKIEGSSSELSKIINQFILEMEEVKQQEFEIKKLEEELSRKIEKKNLYEEKSCKAQLNRKMHIERLESTLEALQRELYEEQKLVETANASVSGLMQRIDKEADAVLEVVDHCKQAEAETEKAHVAYRAQMEAVANSFKEDCLEIRGKVKLFFNA